MWLFSMWMAVVALAEPQQQPVFELIFHEPIHQVAPSDACEHRLCTSLLEVIDGAQASLDFAFYGVRDQPVIMRALLRAKERGVVVRGVVDRTLDGKNYYADTEAVVRAIRAVHDDWKSDQRTALSKSARPLQPDTCWLGRPEGSRGPLQCAGYDLGDSCIVGAFASQDALHFQGDIMHHKFAVADGLVTWMGSTNVSDSGLGGYNANIAGVWHHPAVARWYAAEFEQMFQGRHHHDKAKNAPLEAQVAHDLHVQAHFSPQDRPLSLAVRPVLQAAQHRIDVAIFFLTHKGVVADLIAAHRRGVAVRVILDATAARNEYAKHEMVRAVGIPLKVEHWGGKMHMKAAAIDGHTLILGSMNWTRAGEWGNDENTLIVQSADHASQFHAAFDAMWSHIPDRWLVGAPDPESLDSSTACTDGTDNDFDHLADQQDPGCGPNPPVLSTLPPPTRVPKQASAAEGWLVKGNVNREGRRTYFIPGSPFYDKVQLRPEEGDRWFCSERDAREAGFRSGYAR